MGNIFIRKETYQNPSFVIDQSFKSGSVIKSSLGNKEGLEWVISGNEIYENIFHDEYIVPDFHKMYPLMCTGAKRSLEIVNAGGKSEYSEALSMQYFHERFRAKKYIPEMEVRYCVNYKMCDYICSIKGTRVGVSVTRAMGFPTSARFTSTMAYCLLQKKLRGLVISRRGVCEEQSFHTSILHVFCQDEKVVEIIKNVYPLFLDEDTSDTMKDIIVILTICEQKYIYTNIV